MDTTDNKLEFSKPADMGDRELGLALYHIGAKTKVSEDFTQKFISETLLKASDRLYYIQHLESYSDTAELPWTPEEYRLRNDWTPIENKKGLDELFETIRRQANRPRRVHDIPVKVRYPDDEEMSFCDRQYREMVDKWNRQYKN